MTTLELENLHLDSGGHRAPTEGVCFNEAVAYFAGLPHSDVPACVSPVIRSFTIRLNDRLSDENRQLLRPYILKVVGTNTGRPEDEEKRLLMCSEWLIREALPGLLRKADLSEHAEAVEQLAAWSDYNGYLAARLTLRAAGDAARAKRYGRWQRIRSAVAVADADAAAVADAVAAAAAAAAAVADAAAAAVADAVAAAVAAAAAAADAAADAVAVAVAVAAADADADAATIKSAIVAASNAKENGGDYWVQRTAAYEVFRPFYDALLADLSGGLMVSVLGLLDRLIEVGKIEDAPAVAGASGEVVSPAGGAES